MVKKFIAAAFLLFNSIAWAQSPEGYWHIVNEESGIAEALIKIEQVDGQLQGTITGLLNPAEPNPICTECKGSNKDQAIVGLRILWGLSKTDNAWEGGSILDPNNGITYNASLRVNEKDELEVRGFVGIALLGRTQIWVRAN